MESNVFTTSNSKFHFKIQKYRVITARDSRYFFTGVSYTGKGDVGKFHVVGDFQSCLAFNPSSQ